MSTAPCALAPLLCDHRPTLLRCRAPLLPRLSQFELRRWFEALAKGPLPLFLYNMPSCCKTAIELDTLRFLRTVPNIIGLKDSSGDAAYVSSVISLLKDAGDTKFSVLVGPEEMVRCCARRCARTRSTRGLSLASDVLTRLGARSATVVLNDTQLSTPTCSLAHSPLTRNNRFFFF